MKSVRRHVIITGTGRAGTTFLVQLLTHLGLDTGYAVDDVSSHLDQHSRAGLEHDIRTPNAPYVIKSPWFCDHAQEVINDESIKIDHIFIPFRDVSHAAESRIRVTQESANNDMIKSDVPGGLWHTHDPKEQCSILYQQLNKLLLAVSATHLRVTFLNFPLLTEDAEYCYRKLFPIISSVGFGEFKTAFNKVRKPEWVHSFDSTN
jgi:hypothetical protein